VNSIGLGVKAVEFEAWSWTWIYPEQKNQRIANAELTFFVCKACSYYASSEGDLLKHQATCVRHLESSKKTTVKPVIVNSMGNTVVNNGENNKVV
jgi:hypothetical protein